MHYNHIGCKEDKLARKANPNGATLRHLAVSHQSRVTLEYFARWCKKVILFVCWSQRLYCWSFRTSMKCCNGINFKWHYANNKNHWDSIAMLRLWPLEYVSLDCVLVSKALLLVIQNIYEMMLWHQFLMKLHQLYNQLGQDRLIGSLFTSSLYVFKSSSEKNKMLLFQSCYR